MHTLQLSPEISQRSYGDSLKYPVKQKLRVLINLSSFVVHCLHDHVFDLLLAYAQTVCWLKETVQRKRWSQSTEFTTSWVWCTLSWGVVFSAKWGFCASCWSAAESLQVYTCHCIIHTDSIHHHFNEIELLLCLYTICYLWYNMFMCTYSLEQMCYGVQCCESSVRHS